MTNGKTDDGGAVMLGAICTWCVLPLCGLTMVGAAAAEPAHNVLTEKEAAEGWALLFDGRDLKGWTVKPSYQNRPVKWEAADGVIRGSGNSGYLCSEGKYGDFEMSVEARIWDVRPDGKGHGNSGIKIRCTAPLPYPAEFYPLAYEVQIDNTDKNNPTGSIYEILPAKEIRTKDKEWIRLRFRAEGNRLTTWVNDQQMVDGTDPRNRHVSGFVALQVHHDTGVVEFRNVKIRPLKK